MPQRRAIGIDAGGSKLICGVMDGDLVVYHRVRRVWPGKTRADVLDTFAEVIAEARAAAPDVNAVGIGIPALVDFEAGVSLASTHLPLEDVAFRDLMSERAGLPVYVDNETNLAMLAEHRYGAARGTHHAVMLTIGTGLGGGLVLDGRLYRGHRGLGGELGHITIDMEGPLHGGNCPNRGCLEAYVSGPAIAREGTDAARREPGSGLGRALAAGREITGPLVTELAHDGDEAARGVVELTGRRLGVGIASVLNAFNPEMVVIGGAVSAAGELLLEPAREEVLARALGPVRDAPIVLARFGDEAGMLGAAAFALAWGEL